MGFLQRWGRDLVFDFLVCAIFLVDSVHIVISFSKHWNLKTDFLCVFYFEGNELLGYSLLAVLTMLKTALGYGSGWSNAHAIFYGGSDASGTMGKNKNQRVSSNLFFY